MSTDQEPLMNSRAFREQEKAQRRSPNRRRWLVTAAQAKRDAYLRANRPQPDAPLGPLQRAQSQREKNRLARELTREINRRRARNGD